MKAVILAGGFGSRIYEETKSKPKPMVEIGGKPLLWHIMKIYSSYDVNEFIICCGYKSKIIKQFFEKDHKNQPYDSKKFPFIIGNYSSDIENWNVTLADTGLNTMTAGRLKRIKGLVDDETFCYTYGDTVNDVNIKNLLDFHKSKNVLATVTACHPTEKFGILTLKNDIVTEFIEKPQRHDLWVNGGFFVLESKVFELIEGDNMTWEVEPMEKLIQKKNLAAFKHEGFYQYMDTMKDKILLEELWASDKPPWKSWH